jgi:hypothetical protein
MTRHTRRAHVSASGWLHQRSYAPIRINRLRRHDNELCFSSRIRIPSLLQKGTKVEPLLMLRSTRATTLLRGQVSRYHALDSKQVQRSLPLKQDPKETALLLSLELWMRLQQSETTIALAPRLCSSRSLLREHVCAQRACLLIETRLDRWTAPTQTSFVQPHAQSHPMNVSAEHMYRR